MTKKQIYEEKIMAEVNIAEAAEKRAEIVQRHASG